MTTVRSFAAEHLESARYAQELHGYYTLNLKTAGIVNKLHSLSKHTVECVVDHS